MNTRKKMLSTNKLTNKKGSKINHINYSIPIGYTSDEDLSNNDDLNDLPVTIYTEENDVIYSQDDNSTYIANDCNSDIVQHIDNYNENSFINVPNQSVICGPLKIQSTLLKYKFFHCKFLSNRLFNSEDLYEYFKSDVPNLRIHPTRFKDRLDDFFL